MRFSEKAYRFLLRAYPRGYRARYAAQMEQFFRDRLRVADTLTDRAALWSRTLADWAVTVPIQYWEARFRKGVVAHLDFAALDPARQCLYLARHEASSFSRHEITPEHLLLGILRLDPSLVPDRARETMVRAIEAAEPTVRRDPPKEDLRLSRVLVRVWVSAKAIAKQQGREPAPVDLMAAILREPDSLAAQLLRQHAGDA